MITRALGAEDFVETDVTMIPEDGEPTFLICSDGLTRELDDARIADILNAGVADAADRLVDAAIEAGAHDNVTVIVVETVSGDDAGRTNDTEPRR
jgi:serine/threonine protein phosphatase PrpC